MSKVRPGNKKNSAINGERATHVRKDGKKETAGIRRAIDKEVIREDLKEKNDDDDFFAGEIFLEN